MSGLLAKDPTLAPQDAWKQLYRESPIGEEESVSTAKANRDGITPEELQRARDCGKWGPTEPSDLFLRVSFPKSKVVGIDLVDLSRCYLYDR